MFQSSLFACEKLNNLNDLKISRNLFAREIINNEPTSRDFNNFREEIM